MRSFKHAMAALAALGLLATLVSAPAARAAEAPRRAYVVQVAPGSLPVAEVLQAAVAPFGGTVGPVFSAAIRGGVVTLPETAAAALRGLPGIASVERDAPVRVSQARPPWGLDRIDERDRPLDATYAYRTTGSGVDAYVIDTGLRFTHRDFGGRAVSGYDAVDGGRADDCHGHGTHVAGILGGATYGVAKQVRLIAVRVLDCKGNGTDSAVIAGIDWAIRHHTTRPAVANLSLGGGASQALDTAVANLVKDKVTVAVAAGNDGGNACNASPARTSTALTVAASDSNDALASYSNGGSCVDLIAPGTSILSTSQASDTATTTMSGTSMASPHAAGAAARYLQSHPTATAATVVSALVSASTKNHISGTQARCDLVVINCVAATPNNLLYASPTA